MEIIISELVVVTQWMIHRLEPELDMDGPVCKVCVHWRVASTTKRLVDEAVEAITSTMMVRGLRRMTAACSLFTPSRRATI